MRLFPSRTYNLPSCTLHRVKRSEAPDLAARLVAMDPWRTLEYQADAVALYLSRPDQGLMRFTITSSRQSAGVICLRYPWLKGIYLELLALFPPHQGLGLGREVMTWVEAQVRPHTKNFWVVVSAFNQAARRLYFNLGFTQVACLPDLIQTGYEELLLRKVLA
jgi:ribosomal protein S18 acetylase RimI-like enzyme